MIPPAGHPVTTTLTWALLLFLIPLAPVLGSIAAVTAAFVALLLIPASRQPGGWRELRRQPAIVLFAGVFVALAVAFAITANDVRDPFFALNFASLALAAPVYLHALRSNDPEEALKTISILCAAAVVAAALVSGYQIFVRHRLFAFGLAMGPHVIARLALTFAFFALGAILVWRTRWTLLVYATPIVALAAIYISGTRGAALALPVMAVVYVIFLVADPKLRRHGVILAVVAIAAIAILLVASGRVASIIGVIEDMLSGAAVEDRSTAQRLLMLDAAWTLFQQSPIVGHGWGNFAHVAFSLVGKISRGGPEDPYFQFHNDFANFAVAAGGIGILALIALLLAPIVGALSSPRDAYFRLRLYCCVQLSLSTFVYGLTDITLGYDLPTTIYVFLTVIVLGAFRTQAEPAAVVASAALPRAA